MEYLGEVPAGSTCIYRLTRKESETIRRLMCALTKTPKGSFASEAEYQAMVDKALPMMDHLSDLLEKGPVKLTFEPVEVPMAEAVKA